MAATKEAAFAGNEENAEKEHEHGKDCGCDGPPKEGGRVPTIFDAIKAG